MTLGEGQVEERPPIALEEVEHDERCGQPRAHLPGHVLASEARLEGRERHRAVAVEGEDLRVEHEAAGDRLQRLQQLGIAPGDAVEGARVHLDAVAGLVHLRAHAVVLVLDDVRRPEALRDLGEVEHRRREHHADRD